MASGAIGIEFFKMKLCGWKYMDAVYPNFQGCLVRPGSGMKCCAFEICKALHFMLDLILHVT
jgi:hypothetical protein